MNFLSRARPETDLDVEIQFHIDMQTEENLRAGMSHREARRQARVKFGPVEAIKEHYRDAWGIPAVETFVRDLRDGWRAATKNIGLTAVAVATLALGIGVNTAVFSVVHAVLLTPPPYRNPDRLTMVWTTNAERGIDRHSLAYPVIRHWRAQAAGKAELAAFRMQPMDMVDQEAAERLAGRMVSTNYFEVLGVSPVLGSGFADRDAEAGAEPIVLLSSGLWRRRFSGDPAVLGRSIDLGGRPFTVAGVMPEGFQDIPYTFSRRSGATDFWTPISPDNDALSRGMTWAYYGVARLAGGVAPEELGAVWDLGLRQLEDQNKKRFQPMGVNLVPLREAMVEPARPALLLLLGAATFVLLIACANVAHLLLVRAAGRKNEMAVRAGLGASRLRLMRQAAAESLVLAAAGGSAGIAAAWLGLDALTTVLPFPLQASVNVALNGEVLAYCVAISTGSAFVVGLAPAVHGTRADLRSVLSEGSRGDSRMTGRITGSNVLATAEISAALVLLIGSGLLMKSFYLLSRVDTGFNPANVLTVNVSLPTSRYEDRGRRVRFYQRVENRLRSTPGVESAGLVNFLPLIGSAIGESFTIEGREEPEDESRPEAKWNQVSPGYFEAMSIRLTRGRAFTQKDIDQKSRVVIINETMAQRYWPDENPLGRRVQIGPRSGSWDEIVGVVDDVKHLGLRDEPEPQLYAPYSDLPPPFATFVIRSHAGVGDTAKGARDAILAEESAIPVLEAQTMEQVLSQALASARSYALLLGVFAGASVLMAVIGVYGVIHFSAARRVHEMGIRRALGAQTADVIKVFLRRGFAVTALGLSVGAAGSAGVTQFLQHELYGVTATDAATFVGAAALLGVVAMAACALPAIKAARADPMAAIRHE